MKRKEVEKGKKGSKRLATVVMAAMIVSAVMTAFIPVVAANGAITNFEITPDTGTAGDVSAYQAVVNTTGVSNQLVLNITIPAGFGAVAPTVTGVLLAKVDIYDTSGWYANVTFKAGLDPATQVKVTASDGVDTVTTTKTVNYNPGAVSSISGSVGNMSLNATVTLPTGGDDGYLNASVGIPGKTLTNVSIDIKQYVRNPTDPGDYTFVAKVDTAMKDAIVHIKAVLPVPALTPIGLLALVGILSMVLAFATLRRKVQK